MTPDEAVRAFLRLGCVEKPKHGRKNYRWLEVRNAEGRQIAIFNIPVSKQEIPRGTLLRSILRPNGIRNEEHLRQLLDADDPPAAFLEVLPKDGPRYKLRGR